MRESYLDRKDRLRGEGKVELPLNIDTKKYLIGNIAFKDLLVVSPFALLSIIIIVILHKTGNLSQTTFIVSLAPTGFMAMLQIIKHPIRKNLSFLTFRVLWRLKYNKRKKQFYYQKGEISMANQEDVRLKLGIKNVFSGAFETTDGYFAKVLEVSSVNLSLMNKTEMNNIFESYRTYLNEMNLKSIQIEQIAQPVNLSQYLLYIDRKTENEQNYAKRMLKQSYKRYVEDIQKSRNMVQRKRYIIIRQSVGSDREKSIQELDRKALIEQSKIENMLTGSARLNVKILQNEELIKLIYTCLDYDNAQAQGENIVTRANSKIDVSMGEKSAREIIDVFEKKLNESIN